MGPIVTLEILKQTNYYNEIIDIAKKVSNGKGVSENTPLYYMMVYHNLILYDGERVRELLDAS